MDTIFLKSENGKTSKSHVLIFNVDLIYEEVQKALLYQILVFIIHGKYKKLIQQQ